MSYKWGGKCGISLIPPYIVTPVNKKKKKRPLENGGNRMAQPYDYDIGEQEVLTIVAEKIKSLENLLAKEIQAVADLLKENIRLEKELEETKKQRDCWRKLYRKIRPDEKVPCDRSKAMVVHGEIDVSEALHGSFDT